MSDDRQLRDELERVQSEAKRLRAALASPGRLHADVRARIDQLRKSRGQQRQRLDETKEQLAGVEAELTRVREENAGLQAELDALLGTERTLVDVAVRHLDPGPRRAPGCMAAVIAGVMIAVALVHAERSAKRGVEAGLAPAPAPFDSAALRAAPLRVNVSFSTRLPVSSAR